MVKALQIAIEAFKKERHEQRLRSRLIRKDLDYTYLQKLLDSLSENPDKLMIVIKLANGTTLEIKRQESFSKSMRDPYSEMIV
jgi:hypothetical protein